jgi:hypothetical protein
MFRNIQQINLERISRKLNGAWHRQLHTKCYEGKKIGGFKIINDGIKDYAGQLSQEIVYNPASMSRLKPIQKKRKQ